MKKLVKVGLAALAAGVLLSGCATTVDPDYVGLYYAKGNSDGNKFDHCVDPGNTDTEWNNAIIKLPTSLRTWDISLNSVDQKTPTTVAAKPEEGQPSGVQVNVWSITNMKLNTACGKDGGIVRQFWESIGRRYKADTDAGWIEMMRVTVVPALTKSIRDNARLYTADDLVANAGGILLELQAKVSAQFSVELRKLSGGDFFCSPTFVAGKTECGQVEISVTDVDYSDAGIQDARNQKQKAQELAAAKLAEAQGQLDAANKLNQLYNNKAWMNLELAKLHLQEVQACASNPNCRIIFDETGNAQVLNQ